MTAPRIVFASLVLGALALAITYYPQLPDHMASHFNGAGRAKLNVGLTEGTGRIRAGHGASIEDALPTAHRASEWV